MLKSNDTSLVHSIKLKMNEHWKLFNVMLVYNCKHCCHYLSLNTHTHTNTNFPIPSMISDTPPFKLHKTPSMEAKSCYHLSDRKSV